MVDTSLLRPCQACKQPKMLSDSVAPATTSSAATRFSLLAAAAAATDDGNDSGLGSQEVSPDASPPAIDTLCMPESVLLDLASQAPKRNTGMSEPPLLSPILEQQAACFIEMEV